MQKPSTTQTSISKQDKSDRQSLVDPGHWLRDEQNRPPLPLPGCSTYAPIQASEKPSFLTKLSEHQTKPNQTDLTTQHTIRSTHYAAHNTQYTTHNTPYTNTHKATHTTYKTQHTTIPPPPTSTSTTITTTTTKATTQAPALTGRSRPRAL